MRSFRAIAVNTSKFHTRIRSVIFELEVAQREVENQHLKALAGLMIGIGKVAIEYIMAEELMASLPEDG